MDRIAQGIQHQRALEDSLAPKCREDFIRAAGMTPEDFMDIATQGLPDVTTRRIKYDDTDSTYFSVDIGGDGYSQLYLLDFNTKSIEAGLVQNHRRDRSLGRKMIGLRAMTGLYFGFRHMNMMASLETGGLILARTGAKVEPKDKARLRWVLRNRLKAVRHLLSTKDYASAFWLTGLIHSDSLLRIANLSQKMSDVGDIWDTAHSREEGIPITHADYIKQNFLPADGSMTLAQYLLYGVEYNGTISYRNRKQMDTLEQYSGVNVRGMARDAQKNYPRAGVA